MIKGVGFTMSDKFKAPKSILDLILEEMIQKIKEEAEFDTETLKKINKLVDTGSLIKGNKLLNFLKNGDDG